MSVLCILIGGAQLTAVHLFLQEGRPYSEALCSTASYLPISLTSCFYYPAPQWCTYWSVSPVWQCVPYRQRLWPNHHCFLSTYTVLDIQWAFNIHCWSLNKMGLNCACPLKHWFFFSKYGWPFLSIGFPFMDSTNCGWETAFLHSQTRFPNYKSNISFFSTTGG